MTAMKSDTVRHYYIDNLRTMVIMLVILLHLAVTYSNLGRWYYNEQQVPGLFGQVFFGLFQTFVQGFSMGMLFLVAGYFTPGALDRKGVARFVKERWRRLGLPALVYLLVVTPFICWVEVPAWRGGASNFLDYYRGYLMSAGMNLLGIGPMCLRWHCSSFQSYTRSWRRKALAASTGAGRRDNGSFHVLIALIPVVTAGAFLLRLAFPLGTIFWGMQLCHFSQYIILFIAGILAWHTQFQERITSAAGRRWLTAGIVLGFPVLFLIKWMAGVYHSPAEAAHLKSAYASLAGGVSWLSLSFALWESFVAVSMTVGLMALFRDKLNNGGGLARKLSDSSFAVYVFHPPMIIAVSLALQSLVVAPVIKWAIAGLVSVPLCFLLAYHVLLRVPVLKRIL